MATASLVHTFTGSETYATLASGVLPAFSGSFSLSVSRTGNLNAAPLYDLYLVRGSTSTVCFDQPHNISYGLSSVGPITRVVGDVSADWHCTDWTLWSVAYRPGSVTPEPTGNTVTWTLTYTPAGPPTPCVYGTRPKSDTPWVLPVTGVIIDAVLAHYTKPWLGWLFSSLIGLSVDMQKLCNTIPPTWPAIDVGALLNDNLARLELLQALIWHLFCECVPGSPSPTPYTEPNPVLPPHWPTDTVYSCTNADVCATLTKILKRLDELSSSQNITNTTTTTINNGLSLLYQTGVVHAPLSGSGTITLAKVLGFRLELLAGIPGHELEGNPPYIWDVGWMSCSDGGAMLQERRITRATQEWFPAEAQLATVWGYFFKGGTVARMTELVTRT